MKQKYTMLNIKSSHKKKCSIQLVWMLFICALFPLAVGAQTVSFNFANAKITNDGANSFYEVDIMITTDTDFKLGSGQFYLNYNPAAFGPNIDASGNVTFAHPAAPAPGTPEYILDGDAFDAISLYQVVVNDNTTSRCSFAYVQAQNAAFFPTLTAAGSPHKLAHIKIQYVDVNEAPNVSFDALGDDQLFTAGTTPTTPDAVQITNDSFDSSDSIPAIVWTGNTDNDWDTASNWSANFVPGTTNKVEIPNGLTNYPTASGAVTVSSVRIGSGASLIAQSTFAGTVTYNRTLATSNWYLISSPVVGQDEDDFVASANLATGSGSNIGLGAYDTASDSWSYYQSGSSTSDLLDSGKGYTVNLNAASGDIEFTGTLLTDDLTPISLTTTGNRFNLMGNPYASYVSSANILGNSSSALETQSLWVWDQSANGGAGGYEVKVTVDDFKLAPGQGFFVQADSDGGNFVIGESDQSHQQTGTFLRGSSSIAARPEIHLSIKSASATSDTKIYYIEGTTTGFDNGFDGPLFLGGDNSFAIYTHLVSNSQGVDYDLQSLPENNYEEMVVPIGVNANGQVTFTGSSVNLPEDINVYLQDIETGIYTKLNEDNASYEVALSSNSNGIGRFYLHTTSRNLSVDATSIFSEVKIYVSDDRLMVKGIENGETTQVYLHNMLGQRVLVASFLGAGVNDVVLPSHLKKGVYLVSLTTKKGKKNQKIIIE